MAFFITQLIYIHPGAEKIFDEFEAVAIPLIAKYGGTLMLRIRPEPAAIIEASDDPPYEVHLVEFPTESAFLQFMKDEERKRFLHLKEQAIRSSVLIKGTLL
jgi:uncharacterized protein (DUF1330 family)